MLRLGGLRFGTLLAAIVLAAFALRFGVRLALGEEAFWHDGYTFYADLADELRAGHGFAYRGSSPTAGRLPLYPLLLAALGGSAATFALIAAVQSAISAATVAIAGLLGRDRWNERAGLVAALVLAFYPYLAVHDTALQESGLFTLLTAAAVLMLWRIDGPTNRLRHAAPAGMLLGLAILTRATLLPFALLAILWVVWRQGWRPALIALGVLSLTVSPWLVRNYQVTGHVTLTTDSARFLWVGNNPDTFAAYPAGSIDRSQAKAFSRLASDETTRLLRGESVGTGDFTARARAYIVAHPLATVTGGARKLAAAFGPLPSPRNSPLATAVYVASWLPILVLGLAGLGQGRRRWRHDALIYANFAAFAAVTIVFWAHTSHRSYLDVYLIVFAAGMLDLLWTRYAPAVAQNSRAKRQDLS